MDHLNKDQKNEVIVIATTLEEEMYEKAAEMVLTQSQASFQKVKLMQQIDESLLNKDKERFMELSKQYITLLSQHSFLQ